MNGATAAPESSKRLRRWRASTRTVGHYLDRPYTSAQLLLLAGGGLLAFGVLMAASTTISASHDEHSAIWTQLVREIEFVVVGLPIFWFAMRANPRRFRLMAYPLLIISIVALVAVLVPAFVLVCALVMLEPDLGTTVCFVLILLGLLWMLGLPLRYFALVIVAVGASVTLLAVLEPYRLQRLMTFIHPFQEHKGAGYQTVEGLYALASGGVFGVGLGNGTSKYDWVPNASTDFVFSVIGEELGLIGCVAVLALFALFAYTGMRISRRSADPFVRLAAAGATVWICGQAVINVGYVTALLPVTGIPLPFISAGGTSLLATFLVFGMLVSFARHEPAAVAAAQRAAANGTRGRLERWLRVPIPKAYAAPKRRPKRQPPAKKPAPRAQPRRAAPQRPQPAVHRLPPPRRTGPPAPYRHARGERKRA